MPYKKRIYRRLESTPDRQREQAALIASNQIGVRLIVPGDHNSWEEQNFAIYTPVNPNPLLSRIIIHGRELFSPEAAERYYSGEHPRQNFSYEDFGEKAKNKIRASLSPESFQDRLLEYLVPHDNAGYAQYILQLTKAEIPNFIPPDVKEIAGDDIYMTRMNVWRALQAQGIAPGIMRQRERFPTAERIANEKAKIKDFSLARLEQALTRLDSAGNQDTVAAHKGELQAYLAKHDYDPEIISNFAVGVRQGGNKATVEMICADGIERRCENIIRELARQITENPYDEIFTDMERDVANNLVHSVHPRILRIALQRSTPVLVTDAPTLRVFNDLLPGDGGKAGGFYKMKMPENSQNNSDIIICAQGLNYIKLGKIARHEFRHLEDLNRKRSFSEEYSGNSKVERLADALAHDRAHLDGIITLLEDNKKAFKEHDELDKPVDRDAMANNEQFRTLAIQYGFIKKNESIQPDTVRGINKKLLDEIKDMDSYIRRSFLPKSSEDVSALYNARIAQRDEIPAVIDTLRGEHNPDFISAVLPETSKLFREYHRNNPALGIGEGDPYVSNLVGPRIGR